MRPMDFDGHMVTSQESIHDRTDAIEDKEPYLTATSKSLYKLTSFSMM